MMITMQWLPLILKGKSTDKAYVCLYEEIYFYWGLFKNSLLVFVIYIYIIFKFIAEAFIQSESKPTKEQ